MQEPQKHVEVATTLGLSPYIERWVEAAQRTQNARPESHVGARTEASRAEMIDIGRPPGGIYPIPCFPAAAPETANHLEMQLGVGSTTDFPAGHQVVKVLAEIAKGVCNARHSHPGIETAYVLDGEITITYDGKSPKTYKTGDAMEFDEPGAVHHACATGDRAAKTLSVYVIEKGKPFVTPAN